MEKAELIPKEEVIQYQFVKADVRDVEVTKEKLQSAMRLGNEFKGKSQITFLTTKGLKKIETTIWSATDRYIQIKGGVSIPISSIVRLEL